MTARSILNKYRMNKPAQFRTAVGDANKEDRLKSYTITGQCGSPEVVTYKGSFEPVPGQHDIITALAEEFANGDLNDLISWLGGDAELADIAAAGDEYELANDDCIFRIWISEQSPSEISGKQN